MHIPKEAPTSLMDFIYFGKGDDASNPEKGNYYVRQGNYPFAFCLTGATEKDINKLLKDENETQSIEIVYPKYGGWATSNGVNNQDWYKE